MQNSREIRFYLLILLAMVSWGFAWPAGKYIAGMAPANVIVFWRFLVTALAFLPILYFTRSYFWIYEKKAWLNVFLGAILYTFYNHFFLLGLETGLAGAGGVLVTTMNPIMTYLLVHIWTRTRLSSKEVLGLVLGLLGGLILLKVWDISWEKMFLTGNIFFLLGALTWAFLSMNSQNSASRVTPILYSFYVYTIGTFLDFLLAYNDGLFQVFELGYLFWVQLYYIAIVSTTFGTTVYFFAASRLGSRTASSFIFLVPVTALLGSWVFVDEVPAPSTLIGGFLAILAVYLLNHSRPKTA